MQGKLFKKCGPVKMFLFNGCPRFFEVAFTTRNFFPDLLDFEPNDMTGTMFFQI